MKGTDPLRILGLYNMSEVKKEKQPEISEIYKGVILNVTTFSDGFVFAVKKENNDGVFKVKFYGYDAVNDKFASIKKSTYLKIKFGFEYEEIETTLGDYVSCNASTLSDGRIMAIYDNGAYYIFNEDGSLSVSSQLSYRGSGACDIAVDGEYIWCAVPDENSIIKYSPTDGKIALRIGGGALTTFSRPCSVTKDGLDLYICNNGNRKIRQYDILTNKIKDFMTLGERVYKYIISGKRKFVWTKSGLYEVE